MLSQKNIGIQHVSCNFGCRYEWFKAIINGESVEERCMELPCSPFLYSRVTCSTRYSVHGHFGLLPGTIKADQVLHML